MHNSAAIANINIQIKCYQIGSSSSSIYKLLRTIDNLLLALNY